MGGKRSELPAGGLAVGAEGSVNSELLEKITKLDKIENGTKQDKIEKWDKRDKVGQNRKWDKRDKVGQN